MMPTTQEIEAAKTPRGGWTKETLAKWGVPWPPPKGWRARLEGRRSNVEDRIYNLELYVKDLDNHIQKINLREIKYRYDLRRVEDALSQMQNLLHQLKTRCAIRSKEIKEEWIA